MITRITTEAVNCTMKVSPYLIGFAVSFKIEQILLKMLITTLTLLFAQVVAHYLKPVIIKKLDKLKKKRE